MVKKNCKCDKRQMILIWSTNRQLKGGELYESLAVLSRKSSILEVSCSIRELVHTAKTRLCELKARS